MIKPGAEPFLFHSPSARSALLCVHCFTSTPFSMAELGRHAANDDLSVHSVLLPGHGTNHLDLEKTTWNDWYTSVENYYKNLSGSYEKIFLCGQSLGALLVLTLATFYNPAGIISISSGIRLKNKLTALIPLFKHVKRFTVKKNGPDIKNHWARKKEIHNPIMPLRSIHEIQKGLRLLKKRLPLVHAPVLFIHAADDKVIDIRSMEHCYRHVGSENKSKIILENSGHVATLDNDKDRLFEETRNFISTLMK